MFLLTSVSVLLFRLLDAAIVEDLSCDFNSPIGASICSYVTSPQHQLAAWSIKDGGARHSRKLDGPLHGVANSGSYLQLTQREGLLRSPVFEARGKYCFTVDYYQFGMYFSQFHIYAQKQGKGAVGFDPDFMLLTRNYNSIATDNWQKYEKTISFLEGNYTISIRAVEDALGSIAFDNLKFEEGPCAHRPSVEQICDFDAIIGGAEVGLGCDWLTIDNDNVTGLYNNLTLVNVQTQRGGRYHDHSSRDAYGGQLRSMISEPPRPKIHFGTFTPTDGNMCLSFAYIGEPPQFNIIEESSIGHQNVLLEIDQNNYDRQWKVKNVQIDPVVPIRVSLNVLGGTIRFDTFKLTKGDCPKPLTCDFTQGSACGFYFDQAFQGQWYLGNGRLQNPNRNYSETPVEYPFNYFYADMTPTTVKRNERSYTTITSEVVEEGGVYCFRMTYNINHQAFVEIFMEPNNLRQDKVLQYDGDWIEANANIKATDKFSIRISVTRSISDIIMKKFQIFRLRSTSLTKGICRNETNVVPKHYENVNFHCYQSGHMIPQYRTCDEVIDCPMGEDEGEHCTGGHNCVDGGIPCSRRGHKFCLRDTNHFCNGVKYCDDAIDEDPRMCSAELFCENYCLHGDCNANTFSCDCSSGYSGKRCSLES